MLLVVILPNYWNGSSNGHVASRRLFGELLRGCPIQRKVIFVSGNESLETVAGYRQEYGSNYYTEDELCQQGMPNDEFSILIGDDIAGTRTATFHDLVQSKRCIHIFLVAFAPPGIFDPAGSPLLEALVDQRYLIIFFADWIVPPRLRREATVDIIDVYQEPSPPSPLISPQIISKPSCSVYLGKGICKLSRHNASVFLDLLDAVEGSSGRMSVITRFEPAQKEDLHRVLSMSSLLICFDPFSNLDRDALFHGCRVWKPNVLERYKIPNIVYGDADPEKIKKIVFSDFELSLPNRRKIVEMQVAYSELLAKNSELKLKLFARAVYQKMAEKCSNPTRSDLASRMILKLEPLLMHLLDFRRGYLKFVHPINEVNGYSVPVLNNQLSIDSIRRIISSSPRSEEEIAYLRCIDGI